MICNASSFLLLATTMVMVHSFAPVYLHRSSMSRSHQVVSSLWSSTDGSSSNKRTRRRRKEELVNDALPEVVSAPNDDDDNTIIQLKIMDVRDVVSGKVGTTALQDAPPIIDTMNTMNNNDEDELAEDEEWEYYYEEDDDLASSSNNPLEQMLVDAKSMRTVKIEQTGADYSVESPTSLKNVLSTIVTADFFFVCALLVWFLAGIFCSSILKDDTVQIAFNSNFQMIAQPALGLLMIGSAASAFIKEETEEEVL